MVVGMFAPIILCLFFFGCLGNNTMDRLFNTGNNPAGGGAGDRPMERLFGVATQQATPVVGARRGGEQEEEQGEEKEVDLEAGLGGASQQRLPETSEPVGGVALESKSGH